VDGTLDATFASQGFVVHDSAAGGAAYDFGYAITLDDSGRILVAGNSMNNAGTPNHDIAIWRYNVDSTLDTLFASQGFVSHDSAAGGTNDDFGFSITFDDSGRILVGGSSMNGSGNADMVIWRYE
jgi:uncharacterized delta-60 repeat protein